MAGRQQAVEPGLGVAAVGQVGERVLVGLAAELAGGALGLQQALAAAEQLHPAGAPLVDPVQLVGEVGLQVGQRAAGVVQLGVQGAQLAQRGPAQPRQAVLGGQGQRRDQVLVGLADVALPAQRAAQRELRGGQLRPVGGGGGDADGGAQRPDRGGVLVEADQRPAVHDLRGNDARGVRREQLQRALGQQAGLGEVRGGRLGDAVVQQALAQLGAQLAEAGRGRGDAGRRGRRPQARGCRGRRPR